MSRIGKIPVVVPKEVKITINAGGVNLQGPAGKLDLSIPRGIKVEMKENQLIVSRSSDLKQDKANHGTIRARLANMVIGVTKGHKKELELQGVGFKALLQGTKLVFSLGLSHPVEFEVPEGLKVAVGNNNLISIEGPDSCLVGQIAANIRDLKPVEPYKGKGFRYVGEYVRKKQGKSVTK
ncbi:MAG: 50S ribosomal protein L6 [Candidatus Omnitrophica bacterium]|nr:50S ribosomal protein L6 [Candidatus Omnitrophota bacterium]